MKYLDHYLFGALGKILQKRVFIDPNTLKSLPQKEFLAGYAEVLKYSMINDKKFFLWLDSNYKKIISKNYKIMAEIIANCCKKNQLLLKKMKKSLMIECY